MGGRKVQGLGLLCTKGAARNDNLRVQELVLQLETPERVAKEVWTPHPWRHSRPGWMWLWAAQFGGW